METKEKRAKTKEKKPRRPKKQKDQKAKKDKRSPPNNENSLNTKFENIWKNLKQKVTGKKKGTKERPTESKRDKAKKIVVGGFFVLLLVLVFVGSSISVGSLGFSKCEPGFRTVY